MNVLLIDTISGISLGIECHIGDDLLPEDAFAMTIDFFIVRFTYVRRKTSEVEAE